jgi:hypothetical protein
VIGSAPLLGAILVALALSIIWAANSPIDDPYSMHNMQWSGTSALAQKGFVAVTAGLTDTLSSTNATKVLLVMAPSRLFSREEASSIADVARKGGLLVIADNFGSGNSLLSFLGLPIKFDNRLLLDPLFYRKQPLFPVVLDFSESEFSADLGELVLDYATILDVGDTSKVKVLASSSAFSFLDSNQDGQKSLQEPSGPFPVLAELQLGEGKVLLFTSPASLGNGLMDEANNSALIENIVKYGSKSEHRSVFLYDETHLEHYPFTSTKLVARQLVTSILEGGMQLPVKLELTALALVLLAARYVYRKPSKAAKKIEPLQVVRSPDVETVLRLHPTWDRAKLEYVARELEASLKWRRLREAE